VKGMLQTALMVYGVSVIYWLLYFGCKGEVSFKRWGSGVGLILAAIVWPFGLVYILCTRDK